MPSNVDCCVAGIIPAYAGSTSVLPDGAVPEGDHPRIRGEHNQHAPLQFVGLGSSPHTRGALVAVVDAVVLDGIIPAYAGSTYLGN